MQQNVGYGRFPVLQMVLAMLIVVMAAGPIAAQTSTIHVLTLDETRLGVEGSVNLNFATGNACQTVRNALLNPQNFGPTGTVPRPVTILPSVPEITPDALNGVDVVVWMDTVPEPSEIAALDTFLRNGGGLFVFDNYAANEFGALFGATAGQTTESGSAMVSNGLSPLVNGPFGAIPLGTTITAGFAGSFASLDANGTQALTKDHMRNGSCPSGSVSTFGS